MTETPAADPWVFAYGSLMWQPGFPFEERVRARLHGYHRALCIYSWAYRGTQERPGLVFGLDRGGSVTGIAYRVAAADWPETHAYLDAREMVTAVYVPRWPSLALADGRRVEALAYVADPAHEQYAGTLDEDETLRLVRQGEGSGGPCRDYVVNTIEHLAEIGMADRRLTRLARRLSTER